VTPPDAARDAATFDIRIVGGNPTPEEIAATTAVLTAVVEELAAEQGRVEPSRQSAWQRSQRPFRTPIAPAAGAWRGFSG